MLRSAAFRRHSAAPFFACDNILRSRDSHWLPPQNYSFCKFQFRLTSCPAQYGGVSDPNLPEVAISASGRSLTPPCYTNSPID